MVLPNFIIPGAEKGGTTPLFRLLKQHRDIHMPAIKELQYFTRNFDRRLPAYYEWQMSAGYHGQKAIGEATPEYMRFAAAAPRIRSLLGDEVKFIFCLRDPTTRAFSHYLQCMRMTEESESFERAVEIEPTRLARRWYLNQRRAYVKGGLYTEQIETFLALYPREQMRFLILEEDLHGGKRALKKTAARMFEFLGVDPAFEVNLNIPDTRLPAPDIIFVKRGETVLNPDNRKPAPVGSIVVNAHIKGANRVIRRPSTATRRYYERLQKAMTRKLAPELRITLYEKYFRDEIDRMERLLERDLSLWRPR
ncbi:MAG: sulfotransferase domain-containing protein [Dongiaceae bacterium]